MAQTRHTAKKSRPFLQSEAITMHQAQPEQPLAIVQLSCSNDGSGIVASDGRLKLQWCPKALVEKTCGKQIIKLYMFLYPGLPMLELWYVAMANEQALDSSILPTKEQLTIYSEALGL